MNIVIVGASSGTGRCLAEQAIAAGHEVTGISRSGNVPDGARAVTASATDRSTVASALDRADAVVVAVGGVKGLDHNRTTVTRIVIDEMTKAKVSRLVVQSSLGAGDSAQLMPPVLRQMATIALAKPLADHNGQEDLVTASGLDWTIVRPSGLTDDPATGSYVTREVGEDGYIGSSISRADVAAFILTCLEDDTTIGRAIGIASTKD